MSKTGTWAKTAAAVMLTSSLVTASQQGTAAPLYRWTDANGSPVISDRPPPTGTPYTTLDGKRYGTTGSMQAPQKTNTAAAVAAPNPGMAGAQGAPSQSAKGSNMARDPELCDRARDNYFKIENFPRIRVTDPDGTVRFMTEEEIRQQLELAKEAIETHC